MNPSPSRIKIDKGQIQTVTGPVAFDSLGITDAHNHVWIERVASSDPASPILNDKPAILADLIDYRQAGGSALLDCQPGGCGRDGRILRELSESSSVMIIACTGFHRKKYYSPDYWLWSCADPQKIADHLVGELTNSLTETKEESKPIRAGFIKIALEARLADVPAPLLEGAAAAAAQTGAMMEIHTEKGSAAEEAVDFFSRLGVLPTQMTLCHMDKRPDFDLHSQLAKQGVLLEYDTFYRPKYHPELKLWPLIHQMTNSGLGSSIALATDMAEPALYAHPGGGPGLASLPNEIQNRLKREGLPEEVVSQMLGTNILRRLARLS